MSVLHRIPIVALLLGLLALLLTTSCSSPVDQAKPAKTADMVLMGGNIYTLNWTGPDRNGQTAKEAPYTKSGWQGDAQALAVVDGIIVDVGSDEQIESYIGEATKVIEVNGATVLPGFVDSHTHVPELGAFLSRVNLIGIETEEQAITLIEKRAKVTPEGEWIIGQGWDEGVWANHYPDMKLLSETVPGHPVLMRSLHGFGAWGNKLAFERAGITRETVGPVGGEILHFDNGEPNGLLLNNATNLLNDAIPAAGKETLKRQIKAGLEQMAKDGFVTVHDAGPGSDVMTALQELEDSGDLPIRFYAMISARDEALAKKWIVNGPDEDNNSRLVTRAVKGYYDGALGSRGARMLEDYSDKPGHKGVSGAGYGFDNSLVEELMISGFQIGIHAIGDAGNRETLDFFEDVFARHPGTSNNRHRIEHAQVLHPDDLGRFAEMGIIASMEPPHAVEDKTWAEERIGDERIKGAYAWRSLRQSGATVIFNSDNPGSDHSIFYGLHSAITRQDKQSEPSGGWYISEALSIEEAIRAYTTLPAFASFREHETGVLAPGRWADISVIDIDPFKLAKSKPAKILDGKIIMTIVGGKVEYRL